MQKKKLLGSALALAMMVPYSQAYADVLKNVKVDGSIDLQATSANNVTDFNSGKYDQIGDAQARVMVNAGFDLLDDVHAMTTLRDNSLMWGKDATGTAPATTATNGSQNFVSGGTGLLSDVFVDQAYIKIDKVLGQIDTTLGRQFYGNEGDMVIFYGPYSNLYGLSVSAIDAARFDWSNDQFGVTGLAGKQTGTDVGVVPTGDVDVTGLNITAKGNDMWNAGAFVWNRDVHESEVGGSGDDQLYVYGLKGKVSAGPAWLKAEVAKDSGNNRYNTVSASAVSPAQSYDGWGLLVDLGAKADLGVTSVEPWAEFADGSGGNSGHTFAGINPDYRPGGIYGYFSSLGGASGAGTGGIPQYSNGGLGDRTIWGAGLKGTPAALPKLSVGVSFWDYYFQSVSGMDSELTSTSVSNKHLGDELDVNLTWKHSDNVAFAVGAGEMWAGGAINQLNSASHAGTSPATMLNFTTSVKF